MGSLPEPHRDALERLCTTLADRSVTWALTGSTSFALQGVPLSPEDIDVQTTPDGAYAIETAFEDHITQPVQFQETETIRSHFGALDLGGIRVELMGGVEKRRPDGTWDDPVDIAAHREFVSVRDQRVPVLALAYEAEAYARLGRSERAALLAEHADTE